MEPNYLSIPKLLRLYRCDVIVMYQSSWSVVIVIWHIWHMTERETSTPTAYNNHASPKWIYLKVKLLGYPNISEKYDKNKDCCMDSIAVNEIFNFHYYICCKTYVTVLFFYLLHHALNNVNYLITNVPHDFRGILPNTLLLDLPDRCKPQPQPGSLLLTSINFSPNMDK